MDLHASDTHPPFLYLTVSWDAPFLPLQPCQFLWIDISLAAVNVPLPETRFPSFGLIPLDL